MRSSFQITARIPLPTRLCRATFPTGEGMRLRRKINLEVFARWQNTIVTTSRRIFCSRIR